MKRVNSESNNRVKNTQTTAQDFADALEIKTGDRVRHNQTGREATVTAIHKAYVNSCGGNRYLYTLDFGQSVRGPFGVELNGGEFLREAFTPVQADMLSA